MVQMNREAVYRQTRALRSSLIGLVQFLFLSAVIPLLFILRYSVKNHYSSISVDPLVLATSSSSSKSNSNADWLVATAGTTSSTSQTTTPAAQFFDFLKDLDFSVEHNLRGSDVVELYHCDLTLINWPNFTSWAFPLLNQSMYSVVKKKKNTSEKLLFQQVGVVPEETPQQRLSLLTDMQEEFVLQLLEQFATDEQLCDFGLYRPTVFGHKQEREVLQRLREQRPISSLDDGDDNNKLLSDHNTRAEEEDKNPRLAIIIIAYHDIEQLRLLVDAVYLPDHYIIIHLERRCSVEYKSQVEEMASSYPNVVILQFGTITYRTDSVSMINLRIIRWLTLELELSYDYLLTLDGSAYPLQSAQELATILKYSEQEVWLGELTHKGEVVVDDRTPADHLLRHKRLYLTRGNWPKLTTRLARSESSRTVVSDIIRTSLTRKSTSGNQGIYSHHVIHQLLASDTVMELFALSKYGCCCCLEERNWIAALSLIGLQDEGLLQTSMFQLWGGKEECQSSMNNAILTRNASLCYRIEDPGRKDPTSMYIKGSEVWDHLVDAKERGFLFARKFSSDSAESDSLLTDIQTRLWEG